MVTRLLRPLLITGCLLASLQAHAGGDLVRQDGFEPCQPISANGAQASWTSTFGLNWPAYNFVIRLSLQPNSYIALAFVAGADGQFGTVNGLTFPGAGGVGALSISTVPGCFNPAYLGSNCVSNTVSDPAVSWAVGGGQSVCQLVSGQSYYLNFTLSNCGSAGVACARDVVQTAQ